MRRASCVLYNGKYYLQYGITKNGYAKLLNPDMTKYSGTPGFDKLEIKKVYPTVEFNGHSYSVVKQGIVSCSTGNLISSYDIFDAFVKSEDDYWQSLVDITKIIRRGNDYNFICLTKISEHEATIVQAKMGYYPQGYSFHSYSISEDVTTWSCWTSCD